MAQGASVWSSECGLAYHDDCTCSPAGSIDMSEQLYWFPLGSTRMGWMVSSCVQSTFAGVSSNSCCLSSLNSNLEAQADRLLTLEDGCKSKIVVRRAVYKIRPAIGVIETSACASAGHLQDTKRQAQTQIHEPEASGHGDGQMLLVYSKAPQSILLGGNRPVKHQEGEEQKTWDPTSWSGLWRSI